MAMTILLFIANSFAADPQVCVATWSGAVEGCQVREAFEVSGGGRTVAAAEKSTRAALSKALSKYGLAWRIDAPLLDPADLAACGAKAEAAHAECFPVPTGNTPAYCFVTLDDASCWDGEVLNLELPGWKAPDSARTLMCDAVDKRLLAQNYTDVDKLRVKCAASCAAKTKVNCPQ